MREYDPPNEYQTGVEDGRRTAEHMRSRIGGSAAARTTGIVAGFAEETVRRSATARVLLICLLFLLLGWGLSRAVPDDDVPDRVALETEIARAAVAVKTKSAIKLYPTAGLVAQPVAMALGQEYDESGPDLPYRELFIASGKEFDIPWLVLAEIARRESAFNPKAVNWNDGTGSRGLAQFIPSTWAEVTVGEGLTWDDAFVPKHNIRMQAKYLNTLRRLVYKPGMSEGDLVFAMCCSYNWGPGNVTRKGADASPAMTRNYAAGVVRAAGYLDD